MAAECGICIEPFTKVARKKIVCPSCDFGACVVCTKHYIMNETTQDAHCMNCKVAFTNDFLVENFTKTWNNCDYRNHKTKLLFNEQKSHLPDTEVYVQDLIEADGIEEKMASNYEFIKGVNEKYTKLQRVHRDKINELQELIEQEKLALDKLYSAHSKEVKPYEQVNRELRRARDALVNGGEKKEKEKRQFLMHCCMEDCKGFVNNKYKCGLCETQMCGKCHKVNVEGHVCNEDDVKTVEMIKKTCKNCPKCGIPTHKISGCPQMWCVECHAVWNWNSGTLDTSGRVHNPHYYNFLRNGDANAIRRERGDVRCGGDVDGVELRLSLSRSTLQPRERQDMMNVGYLVIQDINHVVGYEMNKFRGADPTVLRNLRVQYLRNKLTDNEWKSELKKYERRERKKKDYREILGLYVASIQDILRNSVELHELQINDIVQMKKYANEVLGKLNKQYGIKGFELRYRKIDETAYSRRMNVTQM